ncbi:hypothetical protein Metin_0762 [Methanocaldococcus infernus ME]|uniref:Uncharacterized protein n=1 Tax=Methanocaldococcus infernus (strain DSM 11812 / JCM 15783 / ME) TaxID=573063 RepID=D5VS76_METIM|nr:hypothetical protein [Methanocaldococcus infernus]ADG13429.1 hypothetical protein Metin_0762 [Methanocaldococcus infernus ME]
MLSAVEDFYEESTFNEPFEDFLSFVEIDKGIFDSIDRNIKNFVKKYFSNVKCKVKYDVELGENIPKVTILINKNLSISEKTKFIKDLWKYLRDRGYKKFLKDVDIIVLTF